MRKLVFRREDYQDRCKAYRHRHVLDGKTVTQGALAEMINEKYNVPPERMVTNQHISQFECSAKLSWFSEQYIMRFLHEEFPEKEAEEEAALEDKEEQETNDSSKTLSVQYLYNDLGYFEKPFHEVQIEAAIRMVGAALHQAAEARRQGEKEKELRALQNAQNLLPTLEVVIGANITDCEDELDI